MMARLLACWAVLVALVGTTAGGNDPYDLAPILRAYHYDGVKVSMHWERCGEVNAYYHPLTREVTMCEELKDFSPGFIRFVLAHELSHGVIEQRGLPIVGSEEAAADEMAAMVLSLMGRQQDVFDASKFWMDQNNPEIPWDSHSSDMRRGITIWCIARGSLHNGTGLFCYQDWTSILRTWNTLLEIE